MGICVRECVSFARVFPPFSGSFNEHVDKPTSSARPSIAAVAARSTPRQRWARSRHLWQAPRIVFPGQLVDFALPLSFGRRPCDFAGMLDDKLRDRAQRAIL